MREASMRCIIRTPKGSPGQIRRPEPNECGRYEIENSAKCCPSNVHGLPILPPNVCDKFLNLFPAKYLGCFERLLVKEMGLDKSAEIPP
ncbi:hypothetical protein IEQ34_005709 [Dendrobium chrysotoxum]|uniref:Uncharacterized protein n=1 Tax=Dendrobium chrysotoxum TaxID=161865 RepID=A0AAV7HAK2_DENCH|nr:hypothetical protein IEQ34_005709 [Dendrobium chrysotoxum]